MQSLVTVPTRVEMLESIIKPIALPRRGYQVELRYIELELANLSATWGGMNLYPDFQRDLVWTESQQIIFIESILKGVAGKAALILTLNCPNWLNDPDPTQCDLPSGLEVIDGLQRLTALRRALRGEIKPFGLTLDDLAGTKYSLNNRRFYLTVQIMDFYRRRDLLDYYLNINGGGTSHSIFDLDRVRQLRNELNGSGD